MKEVVLRDLFNTTFGVTLLIESSQIINVGDEILAGGEVYQVEGVVHCFNARSAELISVVVVPKV